MATPVKIIVETVTSERDRNGNRYHFARFYLPQRSRVCALSLEVGGESNARSIAYNAAGQDWEAVLAFGSTVPKREWKLLTMGRVHTSEAEATDVLREDLRMFDSAEGGAL